MEKTENYGLNQWAEQDKVLREDFNADNQKIDAALAAGAKIAIGSYVGTGTSGMDNPNSLTFEFAPKMVLIACQEATYQEDFMLIMYGQIYCHSFGVSGADGRCNLYWSDDGMTVSWYNSYGEYAQMNANKKTFCYCAIG